MSNGQSTVNMGSVVPNAKANYTKAGSPNKNLKTQAKELALTNKTVATTRINKKVIPESQVKPRKETTTVRSPRKSDLKDVSLTKVVGDEDNVVYKMPKRRRPVNNNNVSNADSD